MAMVVQGPQSYRTSAESVDIFQPFMGLEPDEFKELASKILIVIPHRPSEGIHASLFRNAGIWGILGTATADVADEFDGFIELTRGGIVRTFLNYCKERPNIEYLVLIDNDQFVKWDAPYRLALWGKDIVSGVVCSMSVKKGGVFACITVKDKYGIARFPSVSRTEKLPAKGLMEIESAGTGLLCVHKRVFEKMAEEDDPPFMIPEEVRKECLATGHLKLGEDMAFCERAKKYGFKMYVDFAVRAPHYKRVEVVWPENRIDHNLSVKDWKIAENDYRH